ADRSPKLAIPINEMPAPKTSSAERPSAGFSSVPGQTPPTVADEGSNRQAVASQRQEPDSDYTQQSAKSDPSIGTGQTKQVSGNVETLSSPPVAGSAGRTGSKNSADSSPVPMTVEPDVIEPEMKQNAESGVAAFNSLAGWRPKQTVTGDVVAGLAIGPARATAAATGNASVQNNPVPLASNAGEVVLEFDANFIDNLTREISNIAQAKGIARFALKPEHLGRIDVEIRGGEQGDDIKVTAETDAIRQLLVQSLSRLEQEIRLNGQKLAGVEIGTNLNQSQEQNARDTASSNGLKPGQVSGSAEDQDAQQYSPGSDSGHTSSGARYA
ncbi:flagellar hook-length control protein FliK, partial [Parasphingorhabdus sp.]